MAGADAGSNLFLQFSGQGVPVCAQGSEVFLTQNEEFEYFNYNVNNICDPCVCGRHIPRPLSVELRLGQLPPGTFSRGPIEASSQRGSESMCNSGKMGQNGQTKARWCQGHFTGANPYELVDNLGRGRRYPRDSPLPDV